MARNIVIASVVGLAVAGIGVLLLAKFKIGVSE